MQFFIEASISNVYETLIEAVILVVLVVFLFLGALRSTVIPIVAIPLCLISIFGVLNFMGYSINNMTLLALVLAIGLVVDDAIVMLENVHRHIEAGSQPLQAALVGAKEIGPAIIAMTLTLAAVYAPIGFTTGLTGDIFREFAFTLAGAVVISGFVALTLSPMMCAHVLKVHHPSRYIRWLDSNMESLRLRYTRLLRRVLSVWPAIVVAMVIVAAFGYYMLKTLPQELAPTEDSGTLIGFVIAPSGSNLNYMTDQVEQLTNIWETIPEVEQYMGIAGIPRANQGISFLRLKTWDERNRSQRDILNDVLPQLLAIPGAIIVAQEVPPLPSTSFSPISMAIQTTGSYEDLRVLMDRFESEIALNNPGLNGVQVDLTIDTAQIDFSVDRRLIADLDIDMAALSNTISILLSGRNITEFEPIGLNKSYDVRVELADADKRDASQIDQLYVRSERGEMIPLSAIVTLNESVGPEALPHYDRLRAATLSANLSEGYTQGEAVQYLEGLAAEILSDTEKFAWLGQTRDFLDSSNAMVVTLALALVFIYLVLAAQFESFRDPLIVMLTVPFSIAGAVIMLHIVGGSNNLYSQIGFVTLIGLITKHGILITEFANQLQRQGKTKLEAVVESAGIRLRPILMTTGAMVLGAIPLALATGAGAYARSQLGWVIVGGMSFGTFFSLFVVPVAYILLAKKHHENFA